MAFRSLEKRGVLSIAAAGNHGVADHTRPMLFHYPASYDSVVQVAAVDSTKALAGLLGEERPDRTGRRRA